MKQFNKLAKALSDYHQSGKSKNIDKRGLTSEQEHSMHPSMSKCPHCGNALKLMPHEESDLERELEK